MAKNPKPEAPSESPVSPPATDLVTYRSSNDRDVTLRHRLEADGSNTLVCPETGEIRVLNVKYSAVPVEGTYR